MNELVYLMVCGGFVAVAWCLDGRVRHVLAWVFAGTGIAALFAALSARTVGEVVGAAVLVVAGALATMWLVANGRSFERASTSFEASHRGWREVSVAGGRIGRLTPTEYGCSVVIGFERASVVTVDLHGVHESTIGEGEVAFPLAGDVEEMREFAERIAELGDEPVEARLHYVLDHRRSGQILTAGSLEIGHLRATIGDAER